MRLLIEEIKTEIFPAFCSEKEFKSGNDLPSLLFKFKWKETSVENAFKNIMTKHDIIRRNSADCF